MRNGFLLLFFTFQVRPRHFWLPNHAFHHAQLPDAMSRKLVWKMVCVNSSEVGSGCGEQGCTSPWRSPRTTLLLHLWESPPMHSHYSNNLFLVFLPGVTIVIRLRLSHFWTFWLQVKAQLLQWLNLWGTSFASCMYCSFYCQLSLELCFLASDWLKTSAFSCNSSAKL